MRVFGTCNKFTTETAAAEVKDIMKLWEELGGVSSVGILLVDATDGDVRRASDQAQRTFGSSGGKKSTRYKGVEDESFTGGAALDVDGKPLSTFASQDDLQ